MFKHIDAWDIRAQIRFERQSHPGAFLVVEGINDDKIFSRFVDMETCSIVVAQGKENALGAVHLLEQDGFEGVACVVDADFDRLDGKQPPSRNILLSDGHDAEMMMIASPAFETVLREKGEPSRIHHAEKKAGREARKMLLEAALPMATCRRISIRNNFMLSFKGLSYTFINPHNLACDTENLCREVCANSPASPVDWRGLLRLYERERWTHENPLEMCNGHDTAAILGIALRDLFGHKPVEITAQREMEAALRLAFDWDAFRPTAVHAALEAWEKHTPGYRILKRR